MSGQQETAAVCKPGESSSATEHANSLTRDAQLPEQRNNCSHFSHPVDNILVWQPEMIRTRSDLYSVSDCQVKLVYLTMWLHAHMA